MKQLVVVLTGTLCSIFSFAQDSSKAKKDIDPSNPTNLYTQLNFTLETQTGPNTTLYGLNTKVQYAFNPDNLVLIEVPLYQNSIRSAFGLGDSRVRYYTVAKKNISKRVMALVPFADITVPTGSYKNGLGSSSWSLSAGAVLGVFISKKLSLFPGLSYVHITKPSTDLIPDPLKFSANGVGLQLNASYKFNKSMFMFINPTPSFINVNSKWKSVWAAEFNLNKIITPNKFKVNLGWSPNFTSEIHILRMGATVFL